MSLTFSFIVENDIAFQRALDRLAKATSDFRTPFNLIGNHWYKGNRKIFDLRGAGLYQPLSPSRKVGPKGVNTFGNYAERKRKLLNFVNPVLRGAEGEIEGSITSRSHAHAIFLANATTLQMGTSVPYAIFHQSDKSPRGPKRVIPQRKMIFIDGGPAEVAKDADISGRVDIWTQIIDDHIRQILTGKI